MTRPSARHLLVLAGAVLCGAGWYAARSDADAATSSAQRTAATATSARVAVGNAPALTPAAVSPSPEVAGTVVAKAAWGSGPAELGRRSASESSPEGPMSFAADEHGRLYVLDQVNSRVSVFDRGRAAESVKLPRDTFQDIALTDDGFVALDRHGSQSVVYFDPAGNVTAEIPLAGDGVPSAGDVTALEQREDGTWVEVEHASLVKVADNRGQPSAERTRVPGRFGADGWLRLSKSGARAANLALIEPDRGARALTRVEFPMRVWQLLALESDAKGRIVIAADLYEEGPAPDFERLAAAEQVVVLDPSGSELERHELPATTGAEESFRRLRVGADGTIHHMAFGEDGVTFRRLR